MSAAESMGHTEGRCGDSGTTTTSGGLVTGNDPSRPQTTQVTGVPGVDQIEPPMALAIYLDMNDPFGGGKSLNDRGRKFI